MIVRPPQVNAQVIPNRASPQWRGLYAWWPVFTDPPTTRIAQNILPKEMIQGWDMRAVSPGPLFRRSKNGHLAMENDGGVSERFGLDFDGQNFQRINVSEGQPFYMSMWLQIDDWKNTNENLQNIFMFVDGLGSAEFGVRLENVGGTDTNLRLECFSWRSAGSTRTASVSNLQDLIDETEPFHVLGGYDGSDFSLYINREEVSRNTNAGTNAHGNELKFLTFMGGGSRQPDGVGWDFRLALDVPPTPALARHLYDPRTRYDLFASFDPTIANGGGGILAPAWPIRLQHLLRQ